MTKDLMFQLLKEATHPEEVKEEADVLWVVGFGCHTDAVVTLSKQILKSCGVEKEVRAMPEIKKESHVGMVVVPINLAGGHNYEVGFPVMVQADCGPTYSCIRTNGTRGNSLYSIREDRGEHTRKATIEEIRKFADEYTGPRFKLIQA